MSCGVRESRTRHVRRREKCARADPVHIPGGDQVHHQLREEEHRRDQRDLPQRQAVFLPEGDEEQRNEIGGNRLRDDAQVTGDLRLVIVSTHGIPILLAVMCLHFTTKSRHGKERV